MPLKEAPARVLVDGVGVKVVEVVDALLETRVLQALVDGVAEQLDVSVQGELVHGVNPAHVIHHKEEEGRPLSASSVALQKRASDHNHCHGNQVNWHDDWYHRHGD